MMRRFFTPRWILATVLVVIGVGVTIRLGIWQLDRLDARRAFNNRVLTAQAMPVLDLNSAEAGLDVFNMEYRRVTVRGYYDFTNQVLLRNQVWEGQAGFHVLTPLVLEGDRAAVLVDRGWIPAEGSDPEARRVYDEPGLVVVEGVLRRGQSKPDFGGVPDPVLEPGQKRLDAWNIVNLERIAQQMPYLLLESVYLQQAPQAGQSTPPYRSLSEVEITEGPHMGYALQWFAFAVLLGCGYPFYLRRQLKATA